MQNRHCFFLHLRGKKGLRGLSLGDSSLKILGRGMLMQRQYCEGASQHLQRARMSSATWIRRLTALCGVVWRCHQSLKYLDMMPKPRTLCEGAANFRLNSAVNSDDFDIERVTPLSDKWWRRVGWLGDGVRLDGWWLSREWVECYSDSRNSNSMVYSYLQGSCMVYGSFAYEYKVRSNSPVRASM